MLSLRSCPRCQTGDVIRASDAYGQHIHCLQCGYMKDLDDDYLGEAALGLLRRKVVANYAAELVPAGGIDSSSTLAG